MAKDNRGAARRGLDGLIARVDGREALCTEYEQRWRIPCTEVCFDGSVTERRAPQALHHWTFGCGISAIIAIACATFGTLLDIYLVGRAEYYCRGDLNAGQSFADAVWSLSRFVIFPIVSVASALAAQSFHVPTRLPKLAGRLWPTAILLALTVHSSFAGPVAMIVYDMATKGTPGDCVLPWWPSWLPS
ncbi:hypothetical protein [Herbidospora cretacea]|uniref:hypothetical protein n=1 Tax=Herbidospora cretacea TaxID=28444 RepID=UPI0012F97AD1|nr:hypothetical protein [Herbidospora cretacea]